MKIMNLKEFYKNKSADEKDIALYLEYLASSKNEINESLNMLSLLLSQETVSELHSQVSFIERLELIIKNSYQELLDSSIENMSDEELASLCRKELEEEEKKRVLYSSKLTDVMNEKEKLSKKSKEAAYKDGYDPKYYEVKDVDYFFEEFKTADEFVMELINSNKSLGELHKIFWDETCFRNDVCQRLAELIINLRKAVKIADEGIIKEAIHSFLVKEEIVENISDISDVSFTPYEENFEKLQYALRCDTSFVANLPETLRLKLTCFDYSENDTYKLLKSIYQEYKETGMIGVPVTEEEKTLENSIKEYSDAILALDSNITSISDAMYDRNKMIAIIKERVVKKDEKREDLSYTGLENHLNTYSEKVKEYQNTIDVLRNTLSDMTNLADTIHRVVTSSYYVGDFEILEARKAVRLMDMLGDYATEKIIEPIMKIEAKRAELYEIIVATIKNLNKIKNQIDEIRSSKNIIKNITGANKQAVEDLLSKYKRACDECYETLNEKFLLRIPRSYTEKVKVGSKPKSFGEIFNGGDAPNYQITEEAYQELRARRVISNAMPIEELKEIFSRCYLLSTVLFTATNYSDGTYEFQIRDEEADEIIITQNFVVDLYKKLYKSRKDERNELIRKSEWDLSITMKEIISATGIGEGSMTVNNLNKYLDALLNQIQELEKQISETEEKLALASLDDETISIDDERAYYEMLKGFSDTVLPTEEVKNRMLNI